MMFIKALLTYIYQIVQYVDTLELLRELVWCQLELWCGILVYQSRESGSDNFKYYSRTRKYRYLTCVKRRVI